MRREVGRDGRDVRIEGIARDGGAPDERSGRRREAGDLAMDGGQDRGREALAGVLAQVRELMQEERVAVGLPEHAIAQVGPQRVGQEPGGRVVGQALQPQLLEPGGGARRIEEQRRRIDRPQREHEQVRDARRAAQQVHDELDRGLVGPVQVVEQERERLLPAQLLEHGPQRPVVPEALSGRHRHAARAVGGRPGRRQDRGDLGAHRRDPRGAPGGDVLVERVDDEPERHLALLLGRPARQHDEAGPPGGGGHLVEQRALPDARLAQQPQRARAAGSHVEERSLDRLQLSAATDQVHRPEP